MKHRPAIDSLSRVAALLGLLLLVSVQSPGMAPPTARYPNYPSETPAHFQPVTNSYNYIRRVVDIPMRDGVKLHTVILIPKGVKHAGILLTRTPYNAENLSTHTQYGQPSGRLGPSLEGYDNAADIIVEDHYIRVIQDVRGKYGSEGGYVMNRPLQGPLNPTPVDDSSDCYDTIDWLVKHVPESNGKVGIIGISYDGFEPLMALVHPHPALKVSVPMNPMVDGWMGDDWFHHGAFREQNMPYIYEQTASRDGDIKWWSNFYDDYDLYMRAVSAGRLGRQYGMEQLGFWKKLIGHPAYDRFWRDQAMDKVLAKQPLKVPVMLVHSLWDQEDIYGALAVYRAIKPKDTRNDKVYLVIGPWHHGQEIGDGSSLGPIQFGSDTALYFREHILRPFLAHYLKDDAPKDHVAPVTAFVTGADYWERLSAWPSGCPSGCSIKPTPLYLEARHKAGFQSPKTGGEDFDEYVSDPSKPVPFRARPIQPIGYTGGQTWPEWLVDDQREMSGRPDVLTYESAVLNRPLKISGRPRVHLIASTSGSDSDWVVKLIDEYPPQVAAEPKLGGYQLMISADIFRGRYRQSYSKAEPIQPNKPLLYRFDLPAANHVFLPGHRLMVQIQSSWFPLYDRNPQRFVQNIFFAKKSDYRKATQRIFHSPDKASYIELPVVRSPESGPPE